MPPLQITVVVSGRVGDLVKGRNTARWPISIVEGTGVCVAHVLPDPTRTSPVLSLGKTGGHLHSGRIDILRGGL